MRICLALWSVFSVGAQGLPVIPENLQPPPDQTLSRQVHAVGDQVYVCDGSRWMLSRPEAKLYDESGKPIGSHFGGPTWEYADGSRVTGKAVATLTPDPDSIAWLLVKATAHQGEGVMRHVLSIQRLATKGGTTPPAGCDPAHKGREARSHYTALYVFYTGR